MAEDMKEILQRHDFVILQITSEKCMPCHSIAKKLQAWHELHPDVIIHSLSIEENAETVSQLGIYTVPVVITYAFARRMDQKSGYFSLEQMLERYEEILQKYA